MLPLKNHPRQTKDSTSLNEFLMLSSLQFTNLVILGGKKT
jgi:hypothetical protein